MLDLERIRAELTAKLKLYTQDWPALDEPPAHLSLKQRDPVTYLQRALVKLDAGTYGWCDTCKKRIDATRMRVVIGACRCCNCQKLHDIKVTP